MDNSLPYNYLKLLINTNKWYQPSTNWNHHAGNHERQIYSARFHDRHWRLGVSSARDGVHPGVHYDRGRERGLRGHFDRRWGGPEFAGAPTAADADKLFGGGARASTGTYQEERFRWGVKGNMFWLCIYGRKRLWFAWRMILIIVFKRSVIIIQARKFFILSV